MDVTLPNAATNVAGQSPSTSLSSSPPVAPSSAAKYYDAATAAATTKAAAAAATTKAAAAAAAAAATAVAEAAVAAATAATAAAAIAGDGRASEGNPAVAGTQSRARRLPPVTSREPYPWLDMKDREKWLFQVGDMCRRKDLCDLPHQVSSLCFFSCLFVCLIVCLFACLLVCSSVPPFVRSSSFFLVLDVSRLPALTLTCGE